MICLVSYPFWPHLMTLPAHQQPHFVFETANVRNQLKAILALLSGLISLFDQKCMQNLLPCSFPPIQVQGRVGMTGQPGPVTDDETADNCGIAARCRSGTVLQGTTCGDSLAPVRWRHNGTMPALARAGKAYAQRESAATGRHLRHNCICSCCRNHRIS